MPGGTQSQRGFDLRLYAGPERDFNYMGRLHAISSVSHKSLRPPLSAGAKVPLSLRTILGTTISQAALSRWSARCSTSGAEATTGTRASVDGGLGAGVRGPVAWIKSK